LCAWIEDQDANLKIGSYRRNGKESEKDGSEDPPLQRAKATAAEGGRYNDAGILRGTN
jgi:hypothetical protein